MNRTSLPDKTIIITGGNSGLGYECAKNMALTDPSYHIIIAGRNIERISNAVKRLRDETGFIHITELQLDLASLTSIRKFAKDFSQMNFPPLHSLVCNAGVQYNHRIEVTEEGYEATFGVNYLGHFLLTNLLLEFMVEDGRIIVLSSRSHDYRKYVPLPKPIYKNPNILAKPKPPEGEDIEIFVGRAYSNSKLCITMFAYELSRRIKVSDYKNISVNILDPGGMKTGLVKDKNPKGIMIMHILWPLMRLIPNVSTPENTARMLVDMVISDKFNGISGKYFSMIGSYRKGAKELEASPVVYDKEKTLELWRGSEELTGFISII